MKNLYIAGLMTVLLFTAPTLRAQVEPPLNQHIPDKPALFTSLPDKSEFKLEDIERLFSSKPAQRVSLKLNSSMEMDGSVMEIVQRGKQMISINLRLKNYEDALFNISRINDNGNIRYAGRIMSINHGDILLLTKENGKYYFIKQQKKFSMVE